MNTGELCVVRGVLKWAWSDVRYHTVGRGLFTRACPRFVHTREDGSMEGN